MFPGLLQTLSLAHTPSMLGGLGWHLSRHRLPASLPLDVVSSASLSVWWPRVELPPPYAPSFLEVRIYFRSCLICRSVLLRLCWACLAAQPPAHMRPVPGSSSSFDRCLTVLVPVSCDGVSWFQVPAPRSVCASLSSVPVFRFEFVLTCTILAGQFRFGTRGCFLLPRASALPAFSWRVRFWGRLLLLSCPSGWYSSFDAPPASWRATLAVRLSLSAFGPNVGFTSTFSQRPGGLV